MRKAMALRLDYDIKGYAARRGYPFFFAHIVFI